MGSVLNRYHVMKRRLQVMDMGQGQAYVGTTAIAVKEDTVISKAKIRRQGAVNREKGKSDQRLKVTHCIGLND